MVKIAVIIANWNGKKYLKNCFDSLNRQTNKNFKVIFVDNGSSDGSVDFVKNNYLETEFPSMDVIQLKENTGFCFGYNTGIKRALEDEKIKSVVILNNDTKLDEKFVEEISKCAERHSDAGSIQPKVVNFFEKDKIDCAGIYITRDGTAHNRGYSKDEKKYSEGKEIFGANGTASLFTRQALEKTKLNDGEYFDNIYFAFYEDVDLAWRIRNVGLKSYYCPQALVFHVHSGTAGKTSLMKAYYLHRNYFFTVFKNYPPGKLAKTLFFRFMSYILLAANVFRKKKREAKYTEDIGKGKVGFVILKAWGSVAYNLPGLFKKRMLIRKLSRKKILLAFFLATSMFLSRGVNAFSVAYLADIHADEKKKVVTPGGGIIYPKKYKQCLKEVKNLNPDIIIAAGDLVDKKKKKYYKNLQSLMQGTQTLWAKGNHDGKYFSLLASENYYTDYGGWRFIVLDSSGQFGSSTGWLNDSQISLLKEWLETDKDVAIVMHHPPFFYNSRAGIHTESREEVHSNFFNALTSNVKYVFSGHWHFTQETNQSDTTFLIQKALTQDNACNYTVLQFENDDSSESGDESDGEISDSLFNFSSQ